MLVVATSCSSDSNVINGYRSSMGIHGRFRGQAHTGVDFAGDDGDPVLASDDGIVIDLIDAPQGVGRCTLLEHHCRGCTPAIYFTSYCHLQKVLVKPGQLVVRGQHIAELGHSGPFSGGVAHLHLQLCTFPCTAATRDGAFAGTLDPIEFSAGCFGSARDYPTTTRPVLTHPVVCK
jgi:murein DD-endopeptidase MepM/ murein hydrolase activator NlpD